MVFCSVADLEQMYTLAADHTLYVLLFEDCHLCQASANLVDECEASHPRSMTVIAVCLLSGQTVFLKPCQDELEEQKAMKSLLNNLALQTVVVFYDVEIGESTKRLKQRQLIAGPCCYTKPCAP